MNPQFLHVGCGRKTAIATPFAGKPFSEVRFDIDPVVQPNLIGTMTDMTAVSSGSMDALFSSHNIEHLYPYEVDIALKEFRRVLKDDGFALITCPDLRSICALVANDHLVDPVYVSPSGPISAIDMLYGHRPALEAGNYYMAHRCGFTEKVLIGCLQQAGFAQVASFTRPECFDLWALATCRDWTDDELRRTAEDYFPLPQPAQSSGAVINN